MQSVIVSQQTRKACRFRKSGLSESENKEVMNMLYKYKGTFSLRDEVGTCQNKEVKIDITDKSLFLLGHIMLQKR